MKKIISYFSKGEIALWLSSVCVIFLSFFAFDGSDILSLIASLIGVTSLIFLAKGNPFGNVLMIIFSILYTVISHTFEYYGEMITYMGMTAPMSLFALISWLKNPYGNKKSQVKISKLTKKGLAAGIILTVAVTFVFYFILEAFGTANIVPSTISVATSFFAAYLTFKRSPFYALVYAANDVVLIVLWVMATLENAEYLSVLICFVVFLVNDLYGFINWRKMEKGQRK